MMAHYKIKLLPAESLHHVAGTCDACKFKQRKCSSCNPHTEITLNTFPVYQTMHLYVCSVHYARTSTHKTCPPLFWTSMHCSAALAVTWLSHNSQYILSGRLPLPVSKETLWFSAVLTLSSCVKALLCLRRLRRWRLKSTSVHSPGKAQASPLSHLLHCGLQLLCARQERPISPRQSLYQRCLWIKPPKLLKSQ